MGGARRVGEHGARRHAPCGAPRAIRFGPIGAESTVRVRRLRAAGRRQFAAARSLIAAPARRRARARRGPSARRRDRRRARRSRRGAKPSRGIAHRRAARIRRAATSRVVVDRCAAGGRERRHRRSRASAWSPEAAAARAGTLTLTLDGQTRRDVAGRFAAAVRRAHRIDRASRLEGAPGRRSPARRRRVAGRRRGDGTTRCPWRVDLSRAASAVFVSTSPDFDARYSLAVLRGALGIPTRGFFRVAPGEWRVEGALTPVAEAEVRQAVRDAPVAIIHGDTAAFGPPRSVTLGPLALIVTTATEGEWYPSAAPPSPLSPALVGLRLGQLATRCGRVDAARRERGTGWRRAAVAVTNASRSSWGRTSRVASRSSARRASGAGAFAAVSRPTRSPRSGVASSTGWPPSGRIVAPPFRTNASCALGIPCGGGAARRRDSVVSVVVRQRGATRVDSLTLRFRHRCERRGDAAARARASTRRRLAVERRCSR